MIVSLVGVPGLYIFSIVVIFICLLLIMNTPVSRFFEKAKERREKRREMQAEREKEKLERKAEQLERRQQQKQAERERMAGYGPETVEAAERSRMTARQKKILGYIRDEGPEQEKEDEILDFSLGEDREKKNGMIRTIQTDEITKNIKEMCIEANHYLSKDMDTAMKQAEQDEKSPLGKQILGQLQENLKIAADDMIPICQDTGMAVIFLEIGQDVHLEGGLLEEAVNEGVRQGYTEGFLRKSVVKDPLIRENTKDNTPAVLHTKIVAGDKVKIKVAPKGFGSENMSRVFMLKPAEGIEGVKHAILTAVRDAGPNACPPMVVGVGIGGTFEKCALMAKEALTREVGVHSDIPYVKDMEEEMLVKINSLGIGPGGLGGTTTALAVNINTYPTHIAGLPVGINICCHVNRHVVREL